jgi:hypothetical protein
MTITGTYNLIAEPSYSLLQLQDIYLECDTTISSVVINLFEIEELKRYKNVKIYISDISNNAGTNNIVINSFGTDTINIQGTNSFLINQNGGCCIFSIINQNQWSGINQTIITQTGLTFKGSWDANTNTPTLTSGIGTNGYYYIVSNAGVTNLDGIIDWQVGDWAIFETVWQKIDNHDVQAYNTIQEEGVSLPQRSIIDFQGGATVTDNGVKTIVNIPVPIPTSNFGLFSQTSTSAPITGTNIETSLVTSGVGSLSIPANGFQVGDSFSAVLIGHLSCVGTATLEIRIKTASGILLADTGIMAMSATTNKHWKIDINFTIRQLGIATVAKISSGGLFAYTKNSGFNFEGVNFSIVNDTTFNTTIPNTLQVTAQWNTNNVGNSIYSELFTLNKIY